MARRHDRRRELGRTIDFMRKLDVKEIHGYENAKGLKLLKPDLLDKPKSKAKK